MILRARQFHFRFPGPALIMGIVNVTPDSFSDGGEYFEVDAAVERVLALEAEGAEIIDLGGESTRPKALPVTEEEELRRVMPVIEKLAGRLRSALSIDTQKPGVARRALEAGASMINDIGAGREDPLMWETAAEYQAAYVAMHMQGTPATMQNNPVYSSATFELGRFFEDRLERMAAAGMDLEAVALDVGIGFGKTLDHNLELLSRLRLFTRFGRPLLLGVSRKSFLGKLLGVELGNRLPASLACACWGALQGANILRVHDVAATVQAVRTIETLQEKQH
jgi:dihydropteroate synthase